MLVKWFLRTNACEEILSMELEGVGTFRWRGGGVTDTLKTPTLSSSRVSVKFPDPGENTLFSGCKTVRHFGSEVFFDGIFTA
jgi:hypothetical protein